MSAISHPMFHDEDEARAYLEALRWPNGPSCPHCGEAENVAKLEGKKHRPGLYQCRSCRKQFSVTVGTLFERSHVPLHKWLAAMYLLSSSKKGMSAHQLHRMLGVTYKTAWFMAHRIREGMRELNPEPIGGAGKMVEADETFVGRKPGREKKRGYAHKEAVLSLVERGGKVQSHHVADVTANTLKPILRDQIHADSWLMTDEASYYEGIGKGFKRHFTVQHGIGEYVRGGAHTNTLENYFSILKRGIIGVYQHCGSQHLKRYVGEFDFRYNSRGVTDWERTKLVAKGIEGKRLTYRRAG